MSRLRAAPSGGRLVAVHAGMVDYLTAWNWQRDLASRRATDEIPDVLLTLEHHRVFTAGKRADPGHVRWDASERAARGIAFHRVDRGGDVTYHGPGQLVAYPVIRLGSLRSVVDYVRALEEVCVRTAADFGVRAHPVASYPGVWVGNDKLAAIGVRVGRRAVTSHGLAFNVTTDLDDFAGIVPCGIADRGVCSLASLGVDTDVTAVRDRLWARFAEVFGGRLTVGSPDDLGLHVASTQSRGQTPLPAAPAVTRP